MTFERTGSAWATVQAFRREGWKFPKRGQAGSGEVVWLEMTHTVALDTLHNPRYAGAFCFGRTRTWSDAAGKGHCTACPGNNGAFSKGCASRLPDLGAVPGQSGALLDNRQARGSRNVKPVPRAKVRLCYKAWSLCGKCGRAMTIRHHQRGGRLVPEYVCGKTAVEQCQPRCHQFLAPAVDAAVGKLLIESVAPWPWK